MVGEGTGLAIGIDLGITNARVGLLWPEGEVEILPNKNGKIWTIPCYVAFTENAVLIGESARYQAAMNPRNTIYDIKRLIGRKFSDPSVQENMKFWPFQVIGGTDDVPMIVVSHAHKIKKFLAVNILSMLLKNLKDVAEDSIRCTVKDAVIQDAVITVPPDFYNSQRQAVKKAGKVAGLNVLQIISDPVASASAYALHKRIDITRETNVLIFDMGRNTLIVSLLVIDNDGKLKLKAFVCDSQLGGENIDNIVLDYLLERYKDSCAKRDRRLLITYKSYINSRILADSYAVSHLRGLCKKAKKSLSSNTEALVNSDPNKPSIPRLQLGTLTRKEFEDLNANFFRECRNTVKKCLRDARMKKEDVEAVILVGGSTRIPKVQELLQNFFKGKKLCSENDPCEVVAIGAAVVAKKLSHEKRQKAQNLVLLDTIPLSLGVDAHDGTFSVIVPRNTPIPTKRERVYFTTKDDQESIYFNIYQGERSKAEGNHLLGKFEVAVPRAPRGKSRVKVVFIIDAGGILNCWVKELTTGLKKKINIDNEKWLISKEKIEKILKDAENYKVEDEQYKKKVFARNALDEYVYNVKRKLKTIRSNNKMIRQNNDMKQMENAIENAGQYLDRNELADIDEYQKTLNQLEKLCVPIIAQFCNQHSFVVPSQRSHGCQILAPCNLFALYVIYLFMLHYKLAS